MVCVCCGSWVNVQVVVSDGTLDCFVSLVVLWFLDLYGICGLPERGFLSFAC